jgi:hypothetical protein
LKSIVHKAHRIEIDKVIRDLHLESNTHLKAKNGEDNEEIHSQLENTGGKARLEAKFRETAGQFIHKPITHHSQLHRYRELLRLMSDIIECRRHMPAGEGMELYDLLWGLKDLGNGPPIDLNESDDKDNNIGVDGGDTTRRKGHSRHKKKHRRHHSHHRHSHNNHHHHHHNNNNIDDNEEEEDEQQRQEREEREEHDYQDLRRAEKALHRHHRSHIHHRVIDAARDIAHHAKRHMNKAVHSFKKTLSSKMKKNDSDSSSEDSEQDNNNNNNNNSNSNNNIEESQIRAQQILEGEDLPSLVPSSPVLSNNMLGTSKVGPSIEALLSHVEAYIGHEEAAWARAAFIFLPYYHQDSRDWSVIMEHIVDWIRIISKIHLYNEFR